MSFYQLRPKRLFDENSVIQLATRDGAPVSQKPSQSREDIDKDFAHLRRAKPAEHLLPTSVAWLKSLPALVRPTPLEIQYPRIVNLLALHWTTPTVCRKYLDDLLNDRRGNRRGFPADVRRSIVTLREYYFKIQPLELSMLD